MVEVTKMFLQCRVDGGGRRRLDMHLCWSLSHSLVFLFGDINKPLHLDFVISLPGYEANNKVA